jgi:hypothetical protein
MNDWMSLLGADREIEIESIIELYLNVINRGKVSGTVL